MKVGAAQISIDHGEKEGNLSTILATLEKAARVGIRIVVFPECSLTGFVYNSAQDALQLAESVPGESTYKIERRCSQLGIAAVVGLLEKDNGRLHNTAALIGPEGYIGKYRKTHTLVLGVDRFASPGDNLPVFSLFDVSIGILICYDQRFPEAARVPALKGAQIILHPSNLPVGAEAYADFLNQSRACENRLFIVHANRVGTERSVKFIGRTQIISPSGGVIAMGDGSREEIVSADIDPSLADAKHVINAPGEYEFDII